MKFFEQLQRLEQMHQLIKMRATGAPKEFAHKMGVSESTLYELLNIARELGACIEFNRSRRTYVYRNPMSLQIGFSSLESLQIKGGMGNYLSLQFFRSEVV